MLRFWNVMDAQLLADEFYLLFLSMHFGKWQSYFKFRLSVWSCFRNDCEQGKYSLVLTYQAHVIPQAMLNSYVTSPNALEPPVKQVVLPTFY